MLSRSVFVIAFSLSGEYKAKGKLTHMHGCNALHVTLAESVEVELILFLIDECGFNVD